MSDVELHAALLEQLMDSDMDDSFEIDGVIPVQFEIICGFREGSQIVWALEEKHLFYRADWCKELNALRCRCYDENCSGRLYIRNDGTAFKSSTDIHDSTHGSYHQTYRHMYCFNQLKDRVSKAPASQKLIDIYKDVIKA